MRVTRFGRLLLLLALSAAFLVWGLPYVLRVSPALCAQWKLATGVCGERVQTALRQLDRWTERFLRPYAKRVRIERALSSAQEALRLLEETARKGLGDERVDAAVRGVDVAVAEVEKLVGEGDVRGKLEDVPGNAAKLLQDLRTALERLRSVLSRAGRRAEDVTTAVDNTRKALDALSNVLPKR